MAGVTPQGPVAQVEDPLADRDVPMEGKPPPAGQRRESLTDPGGRHNQSAES